MKILVVTTWNNKLYTDYAHRFEKTYNWPFELKVYNEDEDLFKQIPDCKKFVERNKHRPIPDFRNDYWKDGVRFCYKVYAYTHAIMTSRDYDGIICIDADSVFYKPIDVDWIKQHIHRDDCMMTYLGRPNYSECGFLYFNMKHQMVKQYAIDMQNMYNEDLIYKEEQQHDSWIWDKVRERMEEKYEVRNHNIGDNKVGHVQARSILGGVYDHTKGLRKQKGKSHESKL